MSSEKNKKPSYLEITNSKNAKFKPGQASAVINSRLIHSNSFRSIDSSNSHILSNIVDASGSNGIGSNGVDGSGNIILSIVDSSNHYSLVPFNDSSDNSTLANVIITKSVYDASGIRVNTRVELLLEKVRKNCVALYKYHNQRHHRYRRFLFLFFRVPLICLSGLNSFVAVGTQGYLQQPTISLVNALVSLFCGIITSIELLINLQKRMENELDSYNNYYKLSIEIYRFLRIDPEDRGDVSETEYLEEVYESYERFITAGNAINMYDQYFLDELELYSSQIDVETKEASRRTNQDYVDSMKKSCSCLNHCFCL